MVKHDKKKLSPCKDCAKCCSQEPKQAANYCLQWGGPRSLLTQNILGGGGGGALRQT